MDPEETFRNMELEGRLLTLSQNIILDNFFALFKIKYITFVNDTRR